MDLGIHDHAFVVTGGSAGLGAATARELLAGGAKVLLVGRSAERLATITADLGGDSNTVATLAADLGDPETPREVMELATRRFGRLDGGLLSTGGPPPGLLLDSTDENWAEAYTSTFAGVVRMMRSLAQHLVDRDAPGSIALVLSSSVHAPIPGLALSNGFRPGLAMLAKTLADELGDNGIRVNSLLPGLIRTQRSEQVARRAGEEATRQRLSAIPLGRAGEPEEFGRIAAFLLSPAASYLNGVALPVDGGARRGI
ncbi:3-oxoacyl-[acyl-carrier protein] reductase [Tamaricihabitans halophyticus]|uniref:3-oxoacyl-[acyl-carrier protein] reductase n=2 Tax=Tamaricihabitans halophyticus TaxID=1262583 RepID=A0A4R2PT57_9PSEU|nr:3-oxoacyl-[acyl-carrier protein] reductase [Tamaricihabitans halophyticus]